MKSVALLCLILALGWAIPARAVDAPGELAGLRLGDTVEAAGAKLRPSPESRECRRSGLSMVPVAPLPGFRSGYVDVGECVQPGRIVRIKMHYADDSLKFFNTILAALKKRYGEPTQWRGNAFGTLRTWKWGLRAADGSRVSVIIMHYAGDDDAFTEGNSIRIAAPEMVRKELNCQEARQAGAKPAPVQSDAHGRPLDLDWFLPR
jgi:hypothetical protein